MLMFLKADWSDNDNDEEMTWAAKFGCNGQQARFIGTFLRKLPHEVKINNSWVICSKSFGNMICLWLSKANHCWEWQVDTILFFLINVILGVVPSNEKR